MSVRHCINQFFFKVSRENDFYFFLVCRLSFSYFAGMRIAEEADVRNNADNLVYSIERSLEDIDGKVDADERTRIEEALENTKQALAGDDVEEIKRKQEALLT